MGVELSLIRSAEKKSVKLRGSYWLVQSSAVGNRKPPSARGLLLNVLVSAHACGAGTRRRYPPGAWPARARLTLPWSSNGKFYENY